MAAKPLRAYQVLLRPIVTEKATELVERLNCYSFRVAVNATKDEIKDAVESAWSVKVVSVRTQLVKGEAVRYRGHLAESAVVKKAYVTLSDGDRLSFF